MQGTDSIQNSRNDQSIEGITRLAFNAVELGVSVSSAPFENIIRREKGSRFQHIVVMVLAPLVPLALTIASLTATMLSHPRGAVGMGIFYLVLAVFTWLHYAHVFWMIVHPEKEEQSRDDGKSLPFIQVLPKGDKWAMARFVYEPGLLIMLAILLTPLHVITPMLGAYFLFGAVVLILRSAFLYYRAWEYIRDMLDQFNVTKKLMGGEGNGNSEEQIRKTVEAALAKVRAAVPRDVYRSVVAHAKPSLPIDLQQMIDEYEK